jgi:hypothetical protein
MPVPYDLMDIEAWGQTREEWRNGVRPRFLENGA